MFARWLTVGLPVALAGRGFKLPAGSGKVPTWGGLRGGISVALCRSLPAGPERATLLAMIYCVVALSSRAPNRLRHRRRGIADRERLASGDARIENALLVVIATVAGVDVAQMDTDAVQVLAAVPERVAQLRLDFGGEGLRAVDGVMKSAAPLERPSGSYPSPCIDSREIGWQGEWHDLPVARAAASRAARTYS